MRSRWISNCAWIAVFLSVVGIAIDAVPAIAQSARTADASPAWRQASSPSSSSQTTSASPQAAASASNSALRGVSASAIDSLPNDAGQVWRDYDIAAYTTRITNGKRPEQAIVDWILRETGYEKWHTEPLSVLCVNSHTLRVYHTPEMQKTVADIVSRFTSGEAAKYTFSMRVITLDSPNWRTSAQRLLRPVPVQTPGVNAWVLPRENAAILFGELRRRSDFRQHNSPYLLVNNGQTTVVSTMQGRVYTKDAIANSSATDGYILTKGQVDEGLSLEFSPLLSVDRRMIDAAIKCNVDQIEKVLQTSIDVPVTNRPAQRVALEVPQMSHYRFHERFRWPTDQVLVLGLGMVALPIPIDGTPLVPGVPLPFTGAPARADLLVFIECKGPLGNSANAAGGGQASRFGEYRSRY